MLSVQDVLAKHIADFHSQLSEKITSFGVSAAWIADTSSHQQILSGLLNEQTLQANTLIQVCECMCIIVNVEREHEKWSICSGVCT